MAWLGLRYGYDKASFLSEQQARLFAARFYVRLMILKLAKPTEMLKD